MATSCIKADAALNIYVSPQGSDRWSGRNAAPAAKGSDGPLATLDAARNAVRAARKKPGDAATVWLRRGVYSRETTLELTAQDSNTTYRAYKDEEVRIIGGREVKDWSPVTDQSILSRLDAAARGKVLQADLRAQGITDYGDLTGRGFSRPEYPAALELIFEGKPMELARWPNSEWAKIASVPAGKDGGQIG